MMAFVAELPFHWEKRGEKKEKTKKHTKRFMFSLCVHLEHALELCVMVVVVAEPFNLIFKKKKIKKIFVFLFMFTSNRDWRWWW